MNIFNIGPGEFFLVLVLALIVFGPQRLPEVARRLGKAVHDLRAMVNNLDPELLEDWRMITQDLDVVREEVRNIRTDMVDIQRDLASAAKDIKTETTDAAKEASVVVNDALAEGAAAAKVVAKPAVPAPTTKAAKPTVATTAPAVSTAATAASPKPATTTSVAPAKPAPAAATGPGKPVPSTTSFLRKSGVADSKDEIVGTPLTKGDDGDWHVLTEVVGKKVYPVRRAAPVSRHRPAAPVVAERPAGRAALRPSTAPRPAEARPRPTVVRTRPQTSRPRRLSRA